MPGFCKAATQEDIRKHGRALTLGRYVGPEAAQAHLRRAAGGGRRAVHGKGVLMGYDPDRHHRRSIRLKGYDYAAAGAYFITICTHDRGHLFGRIVDDAMQCQPYGQIITECWQAIPRHFPHAVLDAFIVMPNHVHGIIILSDLSDQKADGAHGCDGIAVANAAVGAKHSQDSANASPLPKHTGSGTGFGTPPSPSSPSSLSANGMPNGTKPGSLTAMVQNFKSVAARKINALRGMPGHPVWQRNYYEHIIRDVNSLHRICQYIAENPARWAFDRENPAAAGESETLEFKSDLSPI